MLDRVHNLHWDANLQVADDVGPAGCAAKGNEDGVWPRRYDDLRIQTRLTEHLRRMCGVRALSFQVQGPA